MPCVQLCPVSKAERLLLAADASRFSEGAIREAITLAKKCSSKLFVVSVVETNPEYATVAPELVEKAEKETRQRLESVKDMATKEGVDCTVVIRKGEEPYKYIIEEAEKNQAGLIVMGRRGRTGIKRLMMGSVTAKVIGRARCNVLIVPQAARLEFRNIIVAVDGSRYSDAAASEAIDIVKRCGANLIAAAVVCAESSPLDIVYTRLKPELVADKKFKKAEKSITKVKELAKKENVNINGINGLVIIGSPYDAIANAAKEKGADLIVVGSHGRTRLSRLLIGSVTERVLGLAECAVLVVKIQK